MKEFLVRYYPVEPNSEIVVVQLDCLNPEYQPPVSKIWLKYVKDLLSQYDEAVRRYGDYHGLTHYNNSSWFKGKANDIFEFIEMFQMVRRKYWMERTIKYNE